MTDWLNSDDAGDGGFLSLDDPAAPDAPGLDVPTPGGGYGDEPAGNDWLGLSSSDPAPAPVAEQGGWLDAAPAENAAWTEQPAQADPYAAAPMPVQSQGVPAAPAQHHAPMQHAPFAGELTIEAPYLEQMHPNVPTLGGLSAGGDLSSVVLDVEVPVEVFFGDASLTVEQFLELARGAVVELDHAIEAPIELRVRDKVVARGQLVSINGNYGLRVTELADGGVR
jgi:flagellar motor switch protein FliN/FliY